MESGEEEALNRASRTLTDTYKVKTKPFHEKFKKRKRKRIIRTFENELPEESPRRRGAFSSKRKKQRVLLMKLPGL